MIYKIRNKKTNLYARKGTSQRNIWSKKGTVWTSIGYCKSHINQFLDIDVNNERFIEYLDADIVEYNEKGEHILLPVKEYFKIKLQELINEYSKYDSDWRKEKVNKYKKMIEMCQ